MNTTASSYAIDSARYLSMKEFIYALYLEIGSDRCYFYVGRTGNLIRRMNEHRLAAMTGTEDKYVFIREHKDLTWNYEVLHECVRTDDSSFEEFYLIKLLREGWEMTNMKNADAFYEDYVRSAVGSKINSVEELRKFRMKAKIKFLKSKNTKIDNSESTVFVDDLSAFMKNGGMESKGLQAIRARRAKK